MCLVVSDTSPVRALDHLELLNPFPVLFDVVLIPPAVQEELVPSRFVPPGAGDTGQAAA
jgi:hypothetical protein